MQTIRIISSCIFPAKPAWMWTDQVCRRWSARREQAALPPLAHQEQEALLAATAAFPRRREHSHNIHSRVSKFFCLQLFATGQANQAPLCPGKLRPIAAAGPSAQTLLNGSSMHIMNANFTSMHVLAATCITQLYSLIERTTQLYLSQRQKCSKDASGDIPAGLTAEPGRTKRKSNANQNSYNTSRRLTARGRTDFCP